MFELTATLESDIYEQRSKYFTIFANEENIVIIHKILERYFAGHIASSRFLPNLITPFCFRPNFEFKDLAQNLYEFKN